MIYSKSDTKVAKLATEFLENKRLNVCDPLRYLLYTIKDKTAVDSLLQRVFDTNDPALRLIAAEYLMNIDTNRGLAEMIKILPIIEFDHATADSIAIWLGKYGDKKLKHKLEEKEIECKKSGEPNSASWYKWAASTIG
ncbi:MAG: hypothetical protein LBQ52_04055 [Helicobacteraceae bacterium]|nr:hypothetical protein [Helicobacteraceae bacterium]